MLPISNNLSGNQRVDKALTTRFSTLWQRFDVVPWTRPSEHQKQKAALLLLISGLGPAMNKKLS
jgi:hypothetical protein